MLPKHGRSSGLHFTASYPMLQGTKYVYLMLIKRYVEIGNLEEDVSMLYKEYYNNNNNNNYNDTNSNPMKDLKMICERVKFNPEN